MNYLYVFIDVSGNYDYSPTGTMSLVITSTLCTDINPGDILLDNVLPDRRQLDEVVFEVLGLTEQEQLEVYRAVVELVKNRLVKARSV